MPEYRRVRIKGGTYFLTIVTYHRAPILIKPEVIEIFRNAWKQIEKKFPFSTDAICLLPDHFHCMITLPEHDSDYSIRIREIKRVFTKYYRSNFPEPALRDQSHRYKKEATIWQRRFWEHTIRDEHDYQNHFDYIHYNPVKHGFVDQVSSWKWSSFHRYVKSGFYELDWGHEGNWGNKFGE
jgi:putative transposase